MANISTIKITSTDDITGQLRPDSLSPQESAIRISNYMEKAALGTAFCTMDVQTSDANALTTASSTFTVASGAASDTAVIAGTTLTCVDHRETTNVTFAADSSGSLNNTYLTFQDQPGANKYYMWFNINSAGTDPAVAGRTGIMVAGATGALAATLATAAVAASSATVGVTVSAGASGHIIVRNVAPGTATATLDGAVTTGFSFSRTITGSAVTSAQYELYATDTLTAADLSRAINANTTTSLYVSASASLGVVTVSSLMAGATGNLITTTASGNVTAAHTTLVGGVNSTPLVLHLGA